VTELLPPVSIVIPARNEASVIGKTLKTLIDQDYEGPMQVAVCINGDTEGTASVVESHRSSWNGCRSLQIVEISCGSKPAALNTADRLLPYGGIRIYLDADIILSPNAVTSLVRVLSRDEPCVAGLEKKLQPGSSWLVRFFARAWLQLPWIQEEIDGGVYAVNAIGRKRWSEFPNLIADDAFVVRQFAPYERIIVDGCSCEIRFPPRLWAMFRVQRRWIDGVRQLMSSTHRPPFGPAWPIRKRVKAMLCSPKILLAAIIVRILRCSSYALIKKTNVATWDTPR
jgi:cellulose synthase/poly-beta-1,6-N-acetylglucosamine synthase-like glycosyltransferase